MDAQELYNLHEAYMEVYENQQLDEATRMRKEFEREHGKQKGKEKETLIRRKLAPKDKQDNWTKSYWKRVLGSDHHLRTVRKLSREQVDLYDIILSHLDEEKRSLPVDKMRGKMFALRVKSNSTKDGPKSIRYWSSANRIEDTLSGKRKPQVSRGKYAQQAQQEKEKNRFSNRLRRAGGHGIRDSYDYYDIILSHLLDEGYAETLEAAEVMMVNMSEEWRDSIIG